MTYYKTHYRIEKEHERKVTRLLVVLGSIVFAGVVVWAAVNNVTLI